MTTPPTSHRFPILITPLAQPLMVPFGVTSGHAFALVQDDQLHVRFGPMFDERIPIRNIKSAEKATWPRWAGVGPRTNLRGAVGLIGSMHNIVKLTLKKPIDVHLFLFPIRCERLYLSLVHPDHFLAALGRTPAHKPAAKQAA